MALLIRSGGLSSTRVADAVHLTFKRRRTHELPPALVEPPREWQGRFLALAEECQLKGNMDAVFGAIEEFFERMRKGAKGRS